MPDYHHISGFFHKRHIKKTDGAIIAECTYACHRCQDGLRAKIDVKGGKTDTKQGKVQSQKRKKAFKDCKSVQLKRSKKTSKGRQIQSQNSKKAPPAVPLRRSPRKAKCLSLQNKKPRGRKKVKQKKSKKTVYKKPKKPKRRPSWQKKRTQVFHSYWLNGLLFSGKPNDERVMHFREKNMLASSEKLHVILDQPKCCLCGEAGCGSTLSYIACEICGGTFAFFCSLFLLFLVTLSSFSFIFSHLVLLIRNIMLVEAAYPSAFTFLITSCFTALFNSLVHTCVTIFLHLSYYAEWFHGDAFGLNPENIDKLVGFRCHVCRKRDPPICPHVLTVKSEVSQLVVETQSNAVVECNEVSNAVPPLSEVYLE